jgi:hypothetical protein
MPDTETRIQADIDSLEKAFKRVERTIKQSTAGIGRDIGALRTSFERDFDRMSLRLVSVSRNLTSLIGGTAGSGNAVGSLLGVAGTLTGTVCSRLPAKP